MEKERFVLISDEYREFYVGKCYTHQGEYWPGTTNEIENAKVYTSKKRADTACKKLNDKVEIHFYVDKYK